MRATRQTILRQNAEIEAALEANLCGIPASARLALPPTLSLRHALDLLERVVHGSRFEALRIEIGEGGHIVGVVRANSDLRPSSKSLSPIGQPKALRRRSARHRQGAEVRVPMGVVAVAEESLTPLFAQAHQISASSLSDSDGSHDGKKGKK